MKAFLFSASDEPRQKAATVKADGGNLPPCPAGEWRPEGHIDLDVPGGGAQLQGASPAVDLEAVHSSLEREGWYLFDLPQADPGLRISDI